MNPFWLSRGPSLRLPAGWPQQAAKRGVDAGNLGFPVVTRRVINQHPGAVILRSLPSPAQKKTHFFGDSQKILDLFESIRWFFDPFLLKVGYVSFLEGTSCWRLLMLLEIDPFSWWCLFSWTSSSFSANTKWASTIVQQTAVHKYTGQYITHFQRNQTMQIVWYFWGISIIIVHCLGWYYNDPCTSSFLLCFIPSKVIMCVPCTRIRYDIGFFANFRAALGQNARTLKGLLWGGGGVRVGSFQMTILKGTWRMGSQDLVQWFS